jgi:hypothetical protein
LDSLIWKIKNEACFEDKRVVNNVRHLYIVLFLDELMDFITEKIGKKDAGGKKQPYQKNV